MGTSQILMLVLSVIVVGAAVVVGIQMFDTISNNNIKLALTSDIMQHAVQAQAWFRTPEVAGGSPPVGVTNDNLPVMVKYISHNSTGLVIQNPHGYFTFSGSGYLITIEATSTQNPNITVIGRVDLRGQGNNIGITIE